jgi:quinol monooxygenase YgiN
MTITAVLEISLKPDVLAEARTVVHRILEETRAFDGCLGVEVLVDQADETHWSLVERWESDAHDAAYRAYRAGEGAITDLAPLLAGRPVLTKYDPAADI